MNGKNTNANDARERLLGLISGTLESIHATPDTVPMNYPEEATRLLAVVEQWTDSFQREGYLSFRDPADCVRFLSERGAA